MSGIRWKRKVRGYCDMDFRELKPCRLVRVDVFFRRMDWIFAETQHQKRKAWKRYMRELGQRGV